MDLINEILKIIFVAIIFIILLFIISIPFILKWGVRIYIFRKLLEILRKK